MRQTPWLCLDFFGTFFIKKKSTESNIPKLTAPARTGRNYTEYSRFFRYDQLNRLVAAESFPFVFRSYNTIRFWRDISSTEFFTYDPNGNITNVIRNGIRPNGTSGSMDLLSYQYYAGTNRLNRVRDGRDSSTFTNDLDEQPAGNYGYNAIGNLVRDSSEKITRIAWTVYGKIDSIYKSNGTVMSYRYDAGGNRILKKVNNSETIYVRDASGNVMSTYTYDSAGLFQREVHLYGSSRVGLQQMAVNLSDPDPLATIQVGNIVGKKSIFERGNKFFELSNHLGNVLVVVSDRKRSVANTGNPALVSRYQPVVLSAQDYLSFGMQMPGRVFGSGSYRYGFNGKEMDNEVSGAGNQYDYGFRIYNPRLGRFLSVDPLTKAYPWYTPYQYAGNKPIRYIDRDGLEEAESDFNNSMVYNTYQIKASITNNVIRLSPNRAKKQLYEEFAKVGITDETFINNYQIRLRTIVSNHPADEANPQAWFEIENKYVVEARNSFGREMLESAFDVLSTLSVLPSPGSTGFLAARGGGQILISEFRKSMGILFNVKRYSSVGVNNALKGVHKLEDVMEAGMAFVGNNAKKIYTKSGRFEGWESADGLKRFRPAAFKKKQDKYQSNFEQRTSKDVNWDDANKSNMHVDTDKGFDFKSESLPVTKPAGSGG